MVKTKTMHVTIKFDSDTQLSRVVVESTGKKTSLKDQGRDGVEAFVTNEVRGTLRELGALRDKEGQHA